jgi:hypothetical protein
MEQKLNKMKQKRHYSSKKNLEIKKKEKEEVFIKVRKKREKKESGNFFSFILSSLVKRN